MWMNHKNPTEYLIALSLLAGIALSWGLHHTASALPLPIPSAPPIQAQSYVLFDPESQQLLVQQAPNERMEPASLTKIMTSYVAFHELSDQHITLDQMVVISEKAWRMEGSRTFLEVNSQAAVRDLLMGIIIQSGNDASVALAEHIAGSEASFIDMMNHYAKLLNMENTHFMNASGLPDPQHYSTAYDMALLTQALITEFPDYYHWYSKKTFTYNGITQSNRNQLLIRDSSVDGVKTGHTQSAGFCLVSSAVRDNRRLISVMMGTKSDEFRISYSASLLNYGFRFFENHRLYARNDKLAEAKVWQGAAQSVPLGISDDIVVSIPRGHYKRLKASVLLPETVEAPVAKGSQIGSVIIKLGDTPLLQRPLISMTEVAEGNLWRKFIDKARLRLGLVGNNEI